jgi:FtsH-binding integral membrane protein
MSFNLRKGKVRILEPFALFAIVVGVGINIVVPLVVTSAETNSAAKAETTRVIWFFAAVCGLTYALVLLRYLFKNGALDRLLYFIMVAIFVLLAAFTFYLP